MTLPDAKHIPKRSVEVALYKVFNEFALEDQRVFYKETMAKARKSAAQVNTMRAIFSMLTGLSAALAGLIMQSNPTAAITEGITAFVTVLLIVAVVAPAIGGALGTLSDLYQWDRLASVYEGALDNLEVADALSPDDEMTDHDYDLSFRSFVGGTLDVMHDEAAQWGQLVRTPKPIEDFLAQEQERAGQAVETVVGKVRSFGSSATNAPTAPDVPATVPPAASTNDTPPAASTVPAASDPTTNDPAVPPDPGTSGATNNPAPPTSNTSTTSGPMDNPDPNALG